MLAPVPLPVAVPETVTVPAPFAAMPPLVSTTPELSLPVPVALAVPVTETEPLPFVKTDAAATTPASADPLPPPVPFRVMLPVPMVEMPLWGPTLMP